MPLTISTRKEGADVYVLYPIGAIDSDTSPILEKEMANALRNRPKTIVLDMGKTTYITSLGISIIVKTNKELEKNNGAVVMINLPASIKKVFDIIKALPAQRIYTSREELDAYLLMMQQKAK